MISGPASDVTQADTATPIRLPLPRQLPTLQHAKLLRQMAWKSFRQLRITLPYVNLGQNIKDRREFLPMLREGQQEHQ